MEGGWTVDLERTCHALHETIYSQVDTLMGIAHLFFKPTRNSSPSTLLVFPMSFNGKPTVTAKLWPCH